MKEEVKFEYALFQTCIIMKALSIKHLNKNKILNDINLDIEAGEIVALVGPNVHMTGKWCACSAPSVYL